MGFKEAGHLIADVNWFKKHARASSSSEKGGSSARPPPEKVEKEPSSPYHVDNKQNKLDDRNAVAETLMAALCVYRLMYSPKGMISNKNTTDWQKTKRDSVFWSFIISMTGIILSIVENEMLWANKRVPNQYTFWLKIVTMSLTLLSIYFLREYYRSLIAIERLRGVPLHHSHVTAANLAACGLYYQAMSDLLCMFPQPIPWMNLEFNVPSRSGEVVVFQLDAVLTLVMFMRIRMLPRFYGECMTSFDRVTADAISNVAAISFDEFFIFRFLMTNNISMVLMLWVSEVVFFSYCLMVVERPLALNPNEAAHLQHYPNCLWCTIITMTIVGYGDTYPATYAGKIAMGTASICAVIMVAISTNIVKIYLDMPRVGTCTVASFESIAHRDNVRIKAAILLQRLWRTYRFTCKCLMLEEEESERQEQAEKTVKEHDASVRRAEREERRAERAAKRAEREEFAKQAEGNVLDEGKVAVDQMLGKFLDGDTDESDGSEADDELGEMEMGPKRRHRKVPRVPYNISLITAVWDFAEASREAVHDKYIKANDQERAVTEGVCAVETCNHSLQTCNNSLDTAIAKLSAMTNSRAQ